MFEQLLVRTRHRHKQGRGLVEVLFDLALVAADLVLLPCNLGFERLDALTCAAETTLGKEPNQTRQDHRKNAHQPCCLFSHENKPSHCWPA
ncbi:hypothetical protein SDC9_187887 [bioreactor metagenome]|uniref:Uncharacterized protein n=1 Tax=bioreactor metagenome TaxID=1076179 RepID=A0A645HMR9_9ZZZZ